jgi:hypothetical protein
MTQHFAQSTVFDTISPMLMRLAPLALLTFTVGCSFDVRSFSVSARNDTKSYLTLNLAKDVPQKEDLWASPEDIDENRVMVTPDTELGIVTVPPGKTATKGDISGHFPNDERAILRIYRGKDLPMRELLAMQPGADRQDIVLKPGDNRFVIHDRGGKLSVDRAP